MEAADAHLRLYRLSVADGTYEALGDSIPMVSEEIATNANLYYNARLHEFYCVIQEFRKYGDNEPRIYALSAPPVGGKMRFVVMIPLSRLLFLGGDGGCSADSLSGSGRRIGGTCPLGPETR